MTEARLDPASTFLEGVKVLVVEDEAIISLMVEDMLAELGCADVWYAGRVEQALRLVTERRPDLALLDVNVAGEPVYRLAERLQSLGIPFLFATGYGGRGLPLPWSAYPALQKPFRIEELAGAVRGALGTGRPWERRL